MGDRGDREKEGGLGGEAFRPSFRDREGGDREGGRDGGRGGIGRGRGAAPPS